MGCQTSKSRRQEQTLPPISRRLPVSNLERSTYQIQVFQPSQTIPVAHYGGLLRPAASGHFHPMITLGHALRQRGHRVSLIGITDAEERVRV
jgi:hypothetical protein